MTVQIICRLSADNLQIEKAEMEMRILAEKARSLTEGVWISVLPPEQLRLLAPAARNEGLKSVLLVGDARLHEDALLQFSVSEMEVLVVGSSEEALIIESNHSNTAPVSVEQRRQSGDREFLAMARRLLSPHMYAASEELLSAVRLRSPGNLKRGKGRNFSDTPDNFWYVIIQPRIDELSVTVRGPVSHFEGTNDIRLKDDRGNTRFKIAKPSDVGDALDLIFKARRK